MKEGNSKLSGILSIISGSMGLFSFAISMLFIWIFKMLPDMAFRYGSVYGGIDNMMQMTTIIYSAVGIGSLILGVFAIVGGIFALQKRFWGVVLAAAIASILLFLPTGIPAVIFAVMGQKEFNGSRTPVQS